MLRFLAAFIRLSRRILEYYLKLRHGRFLSHPFQFIFTVIRSFKAT
jgi:hypothetical protein